VGGSTGIATGAALSIKKRESGQVSVCFFGEGALGQGLLYETMNMAQLWQLPVIYVCENNLYNEYTHYLESTAGNIISRAGAFGIHTVEVNGQDVREVYETALDLVERARGGGGPAFMLCHTYRYLGHHVGDINRAYYRPKEEEEQWKAERDPLKTLSNWLMGQGLAESAIFEHIEEGVRSEVEAAVHFALEAPYPDPEEVDLHVYA
jgi:TPP-dependent pyruvate/acetoin dehydrogenase alpha subunit